MEQLTDRPLAVTPVTGKAVALAMAFPGALLALGVVLFLDARTITGLPVVGMGPEVFPVWLSGLLVVSAGLMVVLELRRVVRGDLRSNSGDAIQAAAGPGGEASERDRWAPLSMAVLFLAYVAGMAYVGFYTSTFLFAVAAMSLTGYVGGDGRPVRTLLTRTVPLALLITVAIYGVVMAIGMRQPGAGPLL